MGIGRTASAYLFVPSVDMGTTNPSGVPILQNSMKQLILDLRTAMAFEQLQHEDTSGVTLSTVTFGLNAFGLSLF